MSEWERGCREAWAGVEGGVHRSIGQGLSGDCGAVKQACPRCYGKIPTLAGEQSRTGVASL